MSAPASYFHSDAENAAFFDALYGEHHKVVYAYLLGHVSSADTAADLLQETFLRVWKHLEEARQVPAERRRFWLFAIARNLTLDAGRRQAARTRCEAALQEEARRPGSDSDPAHVLIAKERAAAVDAAIARLPEDLRLVLTLHMVGEMSSIEIGKDLQRPPGTVRYQILRARQRIHRELCRAGLEDDVKEIKRR